MSGYASRVIRGLGQDDLPLFRPPRLQALRDHPTAFGSCFEEEVNSDLSRMIGARPSVTLGAFVDGVLAGTAGFLVPPRIKQRHKGHVGGIYVAPPFRLTGLARALIDRLVAEGRASGLVVLTLSVTVGNDAAKRLYLNAGFTVYGLEPAALRVGPDLLDEELMALRLR